MVCWLDGLIKLLQERFTVKAVYSADAPGDELDAGNLTPEWKGRVLRFLQYFVLQSLAVVPPIGLLITHKSVPGVVLVSANIATGHKTPYAPLRLTRLSLS